MIRTRHLACVLLLLSSIGAAEASTPARDFAFRGTYIGALLYQGSVHAFCDSALAAGLPSGSRDALTASLPAAAAASYRANWTMRPPSAQSASVHVLTGFAPRSIPFVILAL